MKLPLFAIETPSFMGFGNEEDSVRLNSLYDLTNRNVEIKFTSLYVDGKLQRQFGFDLARFLSGNIKDVDQQDVDILDADLKSHPARLVSVKFKETRYGFIVEREPEAIQRATDYFAKRLAETIAGGYNRIFL